MFTNKHQFWKWSTKKPNAKSHKKPTSTFLALLPRPNVCTRSLCTFSDREAPWTIHSICVIFLVVRVNLGIHWILARTINIIVGLSISASKCNVQCTFCRFVVYNGLSSLISTTTSAITSHFGWIFFIWFSASIPSLPLDALWKT